MLARFAKDKMQYCGWIPLKRDYKVYLHESILIIFVPKFFPFISPSRSWKCKAYVPSGTQIEFNLNDLSSTSVVVFGPWHVELTTTSVNKLLNRQYNKVDLWDIISGEFKYYIPLLTAPNGKYIIDRRQRIKPLRGIDKAIIGVLPIVVPEKQGRANKSSGDLCIQVRTWFSMESE